MSDSHINIFVSSQCLIELKTVRSVFFFYVSNSRTLQMTAHINNRFVAVADEIYVGMQAFLLIQFLG